MRLYLIPVFALGLFLGTALPSYAGEPEEKLRVAEALMQKEEYYRAASLFMEAAIVHEDHG